MGLDAASNRYPPDIQHGRHTKDSCLRSDKFSSQPPLASNVLLFSLRLSKSSIGLAVATFGCIRQIGASTDVSKILLIAEHARSDDKICST